MGVRGSKQGMELEVHCTRVVNFRIIQSHVIMHNNLLLLRCVLYMHRWRWDEASCCC